VSKLVIPTVLSRELMRFNSQRAFFCFVAAGFLSVFAIFTGIGQPVLPSLPVLLYGLLLLYVQKSGMVRLGGTVKDSPYFLGFILTLVALFRVLYGLDLSQSLASQGLAFGAQVGGAILTTGVGLFFRQTLLSVDRFEDDADVEFHRLADRIRNDVVEFHHAQELLVKFILEFTKVREEHFTREQKAFKKYVDRLESSQATLSQFVEAFPQRAERLVNQFETLNSGVRRLHEELVALLEQEAKSYQRVSAAYRSEIGALSAEVKEALTAHRQHLGQFDEAAKSALQLAQSFSQSTRESNGAIVQLGTAIAELNGNLKKAAGAIMNLPSRATDAFNDLSEASKQSREAALRIRTDVAEIDRIIGDLLKGFPARAESIVKEFGTLDSEVKSLRGGLVALLNEEAKAYGNLTATYRSEIGELSAEVKGALAAHRDHLGEFDRAAKAAAEVAESFANSARQSDGAIAQMGAVVVDLNASLKNAGATIVSLPSRAADAFKELGEVSKECHEAATRIKRDVAEIDKIIDELSGVLGRHISATALRA